MEKLTHFTATYFRRRKYFRLGLIVIILCFWAFIEIGDLFPVKDHDLNYYSLEAVKARYQGGELDFVFLSDPKNSPVFSCLVQKINNDKSLQFVIIGGDLVLYPSSDTFRSFLNQRRDLQIPSLALPGNHDVAFDNMDMYYKIFGRMFYSFALGNSKFILLDNSNETNLGDEQEAWLKQELEDGLHYKYRFVFMHVPLWDPRDKPGVMVRYAHSLKDPDTARRLEELFVKYKVTMLFASHIHAYYDETVRGIHTIISGGAGAELVGTEPAHTFYHYIKVKVTNQDVKAAVVKIDRHISYSGIKKYMSIAGLYCLTLGRIYFKYIFMGFFLFTLAADGLLEYLYRRRQHNNETMKTGISQ